MNPWIVLLVIVIIIILIWLVVFFVVDDDTAMGDPETNFNYPTFIWGTNNSEAASRHQALLTQLHQNDPEYIPPTIQFDLSPIPSIVSTAHLSGNAFEFTGTPSPMEQIWHRIAQSEERWHLILNDTVRLHPQFAQLFPHYMESIPEDAIIVYVGSDAMGENRIVEEYAKATSLWSPEIPTLAPAQKIIPQAARGLHAYLIRPAGARYLLHQKFESSDLSAALYQHFSTHPGSYVFNENITLGGLRPSNYRRICKDTCITHGGIAYQLRS